MRQVRLECLTSLRFMAAVGVVIYHFGKNTSLHAFLPGVLTYGPAMVTFFLCCPGSLLLSRNWIVKFL